MRNCLSPSPINKSLSNYTMNQNCECNCHSSEDCDQDYLSISDRGNKLCYSPSPMRREIRTQFQTPQIKSSMGLCSCEEICSCPCHCITCICCPCVKERKETDTGDYYRNLYLQLKSELELEKKRNERMKYNKKIHENNMENSQKEKELLCQEIEQLKNKLDEAMNKLKEETEKNMERDDEFFTFKQEEIPKIKDAYEEMIRKIKDDANKQIDCLNCHLNALSKENMELKYKLKKKEDDEQCSFDNLI